MPNRGIYELDNELKMEKVAENSIPKNEPGFTNPPLTNRRVTLRNVLSEIKKAQKMESCDWLQLKVRLPQILGKEIEEKLAIGGRYGEEVFRDEQKGYGIRVLFMPTKLFYGKAELYVNGEKLGDGLICARKGVNGSDELSWMLKFENEILYQISYSHLLEIDLWCPFVDKIEGIVRLDWCFDMEVNLCKKFWPFLEKCLSDDDFRIIHNQKVSINGWNCSEGYPDTITLGSMASDIQLQIYNKTKEIEHSGKSYIAEKHRDELKKGDGDVFRVEIRFSGDYLKNMFSSNDFKENPKAVIRAAFLDILHKKTTLLEVDSDRDRRCWQKWRISILDNIVAHGFWRKKTGEKSGKWFTKIMVKKMITMILSRELSLAEFYYLTQLCIDLSAFTWIIEYIDKNLDKWIKGIWANEQDISTVRKFVIDVLKSDDKTLNQSALSYIRSGKNPGDFLLDECYLSEPIIIKIKEFWEVQNYCPF